MNLIKSIFQHIKNYSLANLFGKGANVFIFLLIAKVFSVEEFAQYITLMIIIELLLVFLLFGVDSYLMRAQNTYTFDITIEFIKLNAILTLIIFTSISLLYSLNLLTSSNFFLFFALNIYLFFRVFEKFFNNYLIRTQQSKEFLKITFIISYSQLLLVMIAYYLNFLNITSYFFLLSTAIFILISFALLKLRKENVISPKTAIFNLRSEIIISSIRAASPFLGKNIIGSFSLYSSRILLAVFASPVELAAYGFYLALYFKAISLMSIISATFIPMMKDRIHQIKKLQTILKKYELLYLLFVLLLTLGLFIAYNNSSFIQNMLSTIIKPEYLELINIGFIFILCFFTSLTIMIYDFWQYSLENVAKKIIIISSTVSILSVSGYAVIVQTYGTTEIALYYLLMNLLMLFISRRLFYQIKPINENTKYE